MTGWQLVEGREFLVFASPKSRLSVFLLPNSQTLLLRSIVLETLFCQNKPNLLVDELVRLLGAAMLLIEENVTI